MSKFLVFAALLLTAFPSEALAQPPACDMTPAPYKLNSNEPIKVGFCHPGVDSNGDPITRFDLILPDGTFVALPNHLVVGATDVQGWFLYEAGPVIISTSGQFSVRAVRNQAVSLPSEPITILVPGINLYTIPTPVGTRLWRQ